MPAACARVAPAWRSWVIRESLDGHFIDESHAGGQEPRKGVARFTCGRVINNALLALKGCSIDSDLLSKLQEFTGSEQMALRRAAVSVMAEAPNPEYANEKANAILAALRVAEKDPKANDAYWPGYYTYREFEYWHSIQALVKAKDVATVLEDLASKTTGRMLYCILLARARGGDGSVKNDILKIAQDPDADMMRAWAVRAIATIGGPEDIILLEKVAASDPLQRKRGGCIAPMNKEEFYPVREAARSAIKTIAERRTRDAGP
jgi:hypothetical protein